MEDVQNQDQSQQNPSSFQSQESASGVSFPTIGQPKKSGGVKTLLIVGVLVLVAILGFVIYKSASGNGAEATPTPETFDNLTTPSSDQGIQTITPAPSASPAAKADKSKVAIQIQNGTGITGEAAYLQNQLSPLGYTNVKVGNSESTTTATSVTFATSVNSAVVAEITQKLNTIYQTVNTKTGSAGTFDIVIITGLRKGATPKASGTPTPKPSASSSPASSPSATPTKSPTPTP